jgi:hypothetical protein
LHSAVSADDIEVGGLEGERLVLAFNLDADTATLVELGHDDATPAVELGPRFE